MLTSMTCIIECHPAHEIPIQGIFDNLGITVFAPFSLDHKGCKKYQFTCEDNKTRNLCHYLLIEGIPYSLTHLNNFTTPNYYVHRRFTEEGERQCIEYAWENPLHLYEDLLRLVDDPELLIQTLREYRDNLIPLPWTHQDAYAKLYKTRRLINLDTED